MPACVEGCARLPHRIAAEPAGEHVAGRPVSSTGAIARRDLRARHDRGRRMNEQDGVRLRILEQDLQRLHVALAGASPMMSTGLPRDQVGGRIASSLRNVSGRQRRQTALAQHQRIGRHDPRTAAVGHDRQAVARSAAAPAPASPPHRTGPRSRTLAACPRGESRRRTRRPNRRARRCAKPPPCAPSAARPALTTSTGLFRAAARAADMNLRAAVIDFDVEQDRVRLSVAREIVEHVAAVDIGAVAERDELRETDASRLRPIEHGGDQRARLRHERDLAGQGAGMREAGVESEAGNEKADAVGPKDAQQMRLGRGQHRLLQRVALRVPGRSRDRR